MEYYEHFLKESWSTILLKCFKRKADANSNDYILNQDLFNTTLGFVQSQDQKKLINLFNLNDYLGMSKNIKVIASVYAASMVYGAGGLGSRLLRGTTDLHILLEEMITKFKGLGRKNISTITFPSGYMANLALMNLMRDQNSTVIIDKKAHQSLIDGCKLSGVKVKRFVHNDIDHLEKLVKQIRINESGKDHKISIVVDGIYSMDGDLCHLPEIKQIADKYDALIILDDAHSTGTVGRNGRGTLEHYNIKDWEDNIIIMGTLGKALGSIGGFVTARSDIIEVLKFTSNQVIYSTSLAPSNVSAALTSLTLILNNNARANCLKNNSEIIKQGITKIGMNIGSTKTHIIPLMLSDESTLHYSEDEEMKIFLLSEALLKNGYYAPPVTKPAVQVPRLRISVASTHTITQINGFLKKLSLLKEK
jgi:glycine C-acetyltransferase